MCKNSTISAFSGDSSAAPTPSITSAAEPTATLAQPGGPTGSHGVWQRENYLIIRALDGFSSASLNGSVLTGKHGTYLSHRCTPEGE